MESLPEQVYISLDIDGLSPDLCSPIQELLFRRTEFLFQQVDYLLYLLASSPLCDHRFDREVAPGENDPWDAIVGARLLHKICCYSYF